MAKSTVAILVTCVNSQVAPGIMALIKNHPDYRIRMIGCDAADRGEILGRHFSDHCYSVPLGTGEDYIGAIIDIVQRHSIHMIFPGSDEECLILSEHREKFETLGCKIACSAFETVSLCVDKFRLMTHIKEKGVRSGTAYLPTTLANLENFAYKLGYPNIDFVIKPRSGRGSRGFRIISADIDPYAAFQQSDHSRISLEALKGIFAEHETDLSRYLMMEMYTGDKYSADVLIDRGTIRSMVIRNNGSTPKTQPPTQNARIVFDDDIQQYADQIVRVIPFDYFAQVEIGRTEKGELGLIEVNTRMDATLPITEGLGLNFFREMVTYAMTGKMRPDIPNGTDCRIKLRFRRYWSHLFEETDSDE